MTCSPYLFSFLLLSTPLFAMNKVYEYLNKKLKKAILNAIEQEADINMPLPKSESVCLFVPWHSIDDPPLLQIAGNDFFSNEVEKLLEKGANVWIQSTHHNCTPFYRAALGAPKNLSSLINHVRTKTPGSLYKIHASVLGKTPLDATTFLYNVDCMKLLLQAGALIHEPSIGKSGSLIRLIKQYCDRLPYYCPDIKDIIILFSIFGTNLQTKIEPKGHRDNLPLISLAHYIRSNSVGDEKLAQLLETTLPAMQQMQNLQKDPRSFISYLPRELIIPTGQYIIGSEISYV